MDQETIKVYDEKFEDYAKLVKTNKPSEALDRFMAQVKPGGGVLDLGCGPGNAAGTLVARGFGVTALDASEGMISLVRQIEGVEPVLADFDWLLDREDEFDAVWANFALLHAAADKLEIYLDAVVRSLKAEGVLHLGMKTGEGELRDSLGRKYIYRSRETFEALLEERGFEILDVREGEDVALAGGIDPFVLILARLKA